MCCQFISGWWFGTWLDYDFPYIGNFIIPTDKLIFFRGAGIPPTRDIHSSFETNPIDDSALGQAPEAETIRGYFRGSG